MVNSAGRSDRKIWYAILILVADIMSIISLLYILAVTLIAVDIPAARSIIIFIASCSLYYLAFKGLGITEYLDILKRLARSLIIAVWILTSVVIVEIFRGKPLDPIRISILVSGVVIFFMNLTKIVLDKKIRSRRQKKQKNRRASDETPGSSLSDKKAKGLAP